MVCLGERTLSGNKYVTKLLRAPNDGAGALSTPEIVTRLLLMRGMSSGCGRSDIARVRYFRCVGERGDRMFVIQDYAERAERRSVASPAELLTDKTRERFGDLDVSNVIETEDGPKVVDAFVKPSAMTGQFVLGGCSGRRCTCDWEAFAKRSDGGFGEVPLDFEMPPFFAEKEGTKDYRWIGEIKASARG